MVGVPDRDPVIVVGSGIAGGLLGLAAAESGPVVLVTKGPLGEGSTRRAQGGIAAAVDAGDTVDAHVADTLAAGAGLNDVEAVARICAEGPAQVATLLRRGVRFDLDALGGLELAREGAHSAARVVHAGGDATGAHIVAALAGALRRDPRVLIAEHERALEVVVRHGRACGLRTRTADGREIVRWARAVVLAAGGSGQLYARTTNPPGATADGPALAARAGAAVADLELIQFHPTALALGDGPLGLVSEAVRGEGAILRDATGHRFMPDEHPMAELGPRDVVARAIARRARELHAEVTLDLRHLDPVEVHRRFPTVAAICAEHGLDLARDPIPVTPAAHYGIGGVLTDMGGRSTLPGLFAIGECAATGAHGANRLASNGLLEAAVMAAGAAEAITLDPDGWPEGPVAPAVAPLAGAPATPGARHAVQAAMWDGVGVERDAAGLAAAASVLESVAPGDDPETANLLLVARLTAAAADIRAESRGAHHRSDFPLPDPAQVRRIAWVGAQPYLVPDARHGRILALEAA